MTSLFMPSVTPSSSKANTLKPRRRLQQNNCEGVFAVLVDFQPSKALHAAKYMAPGGPTFGCFLHKDVCRKADKLLAPRYNS